MQSEKASRLPVLASQHDEDVGNIPLSTISVLVQQHSRTRTIDQTFTSLLQEIKTDPHHNISLDEAENSSLIHALCQTCLVALDNTSVGIDHAVACLDVIELTIRRTPRVLFHLCGPDSATGTELCLWLYPRLFSGLQHLPPPEFQGRIEVIISSSLLALRNDFRNVRYARRLLKFYQICIEDIIAALEVWNSSASPDSELRFAIPTIVAREAIGATDMQPFVWEEYQICVTGFQHVIRVAVTLLSALTEQNEADTRINPTRDDARHVWLVTKSAQLWHCIKTTRTTLIAELDYATLCCQVRLAIRLGRSITIHSARIVQQRMSEHMMDIAGALVPIASVLRSGEVLDTVASFFTFLTRSIHQDCYTRKAAGAKLALSVETLLYTWAESPSELRKTISIMYAAIHGTCEADRATPSRKTPSRPDVRPSKRQKIVDSASKNLEERPSLSTLGNFCSLLGHVGPQDSSSLAAAITTLYPSLSEKQQTRALRCLVRTLDTMPHPDLVDTSASDRVSLPSRSSVEVQQFNSLFDIICTLLSMPITRVHKQQRLLLTNAIRLLAGRTPNPDHLDLTTSALGTWCIQCLHSSSRQLRVAAALTLPGFLNNRVWPDLDRNNRVILLDLLRGLSGMQDHRLCEAATVMYGRIACVCDEDERAIALHQLVEYLGHTSKSLSDMAYLEIRHVAHFTASNAPRVLFKPFWKIIGVTAVKDILRRPQKIQQLSDLMDLSVNQLLVIIQADVVPWLVLEKRQEILQRVAKARGRETTVWALCMARRNLVAILSSITVQHPSNLIEAMSDRLAYASAEFAKEDVTNLLKAEQIAVACEVLKVAGDKNGVDREQVAKFPAANACDLAD